MLYSVIVGVIVLVIAGNLRRRVSSGRGRRCRGTVVRIGVGVRVWQNDRREEVAVKEKEVPAKERIEDEIEAGIHCEKELGP